MKRFVRAVAAVSAMLWSGAALAQTAPTVATTSFVAIDAVTVDHSTLAVTGVIEGEPAAVTREFHFAFTNYSSTHPYEQRQSCERLALLAMSKPGQYVFKVTVESYRWDYPSCSLARATP